MGVSQSVGAGRWTSPKKSRRAGPPDTNSIRTPKRADLGAWPMSAGRMSTIGQCLSDLRGSGAGGQTDGQLLQSFIDCRDGDAVTALVRRHGPMVLGVCRRVLGGTHDAEDAFQATFLVLVRKATSIVPRELVGNWLYGVAYRTALEARARNARRRAREKQVRDMPDHAVESEAAWPEL